MIVAKKRIYLSILIALLIFALICGIFIGIENKYIVYADEISVEENELVHDSVSNSVNEVDYNINNENYHYSQQEAEFEIVNADGSVAIDDCIIVNYGNVSVELPMFDYYRVLDCNGNVRFFQADTLKDEYIEKFAFVGLYLPSIDFDIDKYTFVVQYFSNNKLFNITVLLDSNRVEFFDSISIDIILDDGEVSSRLKEAVRIQSKGKVASSEELGNKTEIKALNSIAPKSYDTYTNTDGIIRAYPTSYFGQYIKNGLIGDDPIVRIVPKELMFIAGQHIYVGKQYGFFINTVRNASGNDNYADVLVFDIFHRTPYYSEGSSAEGELGTTRVSPLFQYRYRTLDNIGNNSGFVSGLTRVVYPHTHFDAAQYYISDIGFKNSLFSPTILNEGDNGYNVYEDDGMFICETRYGSYSGEGLKRLNEDFFIDTIVFCYGFYPYVGPAISTAGFVYSVFDGFGNSGYIDRVGTTGYGKDYSMVFEEYKTKRDDQISTYNHLIKAVSSSQVPDVNCPRYINVGNGYSEFSYKINSRGDSVRYNRVNVVTSISLTIVEDYNSKIHNYGRATGTYDVSQYEYIEDISNDVLRYGHIKKNIEAGASGKIFRFAPKTSGKYLLRNYGVKAPKIIVHDATNKIDTEASTSHTVDMVADNVYYIEIDKTNNTQYSYDFHVGYAPESNVTAYSGSKKSISLTSKTNVVYEFTPSYSMTYSIYTELTSGDPYLILLDSSGVRLSYNDDSNGRNAKIDYAFVADQTYYIVAQGYNATAAVFDMFISKPQMAVETFYDIEAGGPQYFEFIAPYDGKYYLYTEFVTNYVGPAYLEIYDSNNKLLASDSKGRHVADHAAITISLTRGQKYKIMAAHINYSYFHYGLVMKYVENLEDYI